MQPFPIALSRQTPRLPVSAAVGLGLRRALLDSLNTAPAGAFDFLERAPENWIGIGGAHGAALLGELDSIRRLQADAGQAPGRPWLSWRSLSRPSSRPSRLTCATPSTRRCPPAWTAREAGIDDLETFVANGLSLLQQMHAQAILGPM